MTENFKTSEAEELFEIRFIKVPFEGASFKEINDNIRVALKQNHDLRIVIRGLDMRLFLEDKDYMREDLGTYPTYLYDNNCFNDVYYIFNRDVFFSRVVPMIQMNREGVAGGITSFDEYSNWMSGYTFGPKVLYPDGIEIEDIPHQDDISVEEKKRVMDNVRQNITDLADEYPDSTFYYFFTPYSAAWWKTLLETGRLNKQIKAEQIVIEEVLRHDNIKLFSFNTIDSITTDLNNYKDELHYGEWVNSLILKYMYENKYRLTDTNYNEYLQKELELYATFDYSTLID